MTSKNDPALRARMKEDLMSHAPMVEVNCPSCHGDGVTGTARLACWKCQGTGVIRRTADHLSDALESTAPVPKRRGRPVGSKNQTTEVDMSETVEKTQDSIVWWLPVIRSGGREPIVRISDDGKVSISIAVFSLLGIDPKEVRRFRMGNDANNTLVIQFAPSKDAPESAYPWRMNRDRSIWTRPVEHLNQIQLTAGRYRAKVDAGRRLIIVTPSNRLADGSSDKAA